MGFINLGTIFRKISEARKFKYENSAKHERKARQRDIEKFQELEQRRQSFKSILVDTVEKYLPTTSENFLLVEIPQECTELMELSIAEADIRQKFDIVPDQDDKCRYLFAWAVIDVL